MIRPVPGRRVRLFPSIAIATLAVIALPSVTIAQMKTDRGGQGATDGSPTFKLGELTVTSPWTRATPGGAKIAGGYLKITNTGSSADRFVGAKTEEAGHLEIHEMSTSEGVMKMRPLPNGLEIKPGETVELKPGGYHLMFMDIRVPFKQGDTIKATLQFEKAGSLDVKFSVRALGATNGEVMSPRPGTGGLY